MMPATLNDDKNTFVAYQADAVRGDAQALCRDVEEGVDHADGHAACGVCYYVNSKRVDNRRTKKEKTKQEIRNKTTNKPRNKPKKQTKETNQNKQTNEQMNK